MRPRPFTTRRLTTAVSVALASTALAALPAHATQNAPAQPYNLTVTHDPASTDFDHRSVDVSGVLTKADGTPVAGGAVVLTESLQFWNWNPWGDPMPDDRWSRHELGTVHTDQDGRFTLKDVPVDNLDNLNLMGATKRVSVNADYDPDGDPSTYDDIYVSDDWTAQTTATTLTAKADKTRVHTGDTVTVTGTVSVPEGYGSPHRMDVYLRAYYEDEWTVRTTTDDAGRYSFRYTVRDGDSGFTVESLPSDFYLAGSWADPSIAHPVPLTYSNLSAAVDRNGVATVKAHLDVPYGSSKEKVNLQFAATGEKTWHTVATVTDNTNGDVQATYKGGNGIYRWSHPESDNFLLASSASRTVYRTPERIAGFRGTPQPVRKGTPLRLSGTLQFLDGKTWKNRGVHPVEIWYRPTSTSTWVRKAVINSSSTGYFQKTLTATTDGWWRAVQTGDATSTYTAVSPSDWIDVR